ASLGNISYSEQDDTTVVVYLGNHELVVQAHARTVHTEPDPDDPGMNRLVFDLDGDPVEVTTGELRGVLDARDGDLPNLLDKLNTFASTLIAEVIAVHAAGFGLDGVDGRDFFTGTDAFDIDLNADLAANPHWVAAASGPGAPGDGTNALALANPQLAETMLGNTQTFDTYYGNIVIVLC